MSDVVAPRDEERTKTRHAASRTARRRSPAWSLGRGVVALTSGSLGQLLGRARLLVLAHVVERREGDCGADEHEDRRDRQAVVQAVRERDGAGVARLDAVLRAR